ncbi:class III extradiol ring-cleavage dioxygenase [Ammonicoccus fulvus]|uniref:Class III extradiol ring-cleavage dioxygenase n=1 Tax=Ammonicoccus fulvus TaxID=3138240 RepID=A0ABZ3FQ46_9ACTN
MTRQPVLFLGHGAPPLADDARWTRELADWSARIPRPERILMISAHWESRPATVSAHLAPQPLVYDFWGFPERYYTVTYPAPVAPELASDVAGLLGADNVAADHERGLDHGAYVPLVEMYPDADIPVLQLSLPMLAPQELFDLGRTLTPLRDSGTLIIGSGFTTHNLRWFNPRQPADAPAPTPSVEFDHWADEAVSSMDVEALLNFTETAPAALEAHPRTEHWAPLYVALGAADAGSGTPSTAVDGFWFGLSKRSWEFN